MCFECDECGKEFDTEWGLNSHRGQSHGRVLDDEEELRRLYVEEKLSITEIADLKGCSSATVSRRLEEYGIGRRSISESMKQKYGLTEEEIRRLYVEKGLSIRDIADLKGCSYTLVRSRMNEFEIQLRESGPTRNSHAGYSTKPSGYKRWLGYRGYDKREKVFVHQLLACMDHDPHEVFAEDTHVHHGADNHDSLPPVELKWANWEGNLEVMTAPEHRKHHAENPRWNPDTPNESGTKSILEVI